MEQHFKVYEYTMDGESYHFQAHSEREARMSRDYAVIHFQEVLGDRFSRARLQGPRLVMTPAEAIAAEERQPEERRSA